MDANKILGIVLAAIFAAGLLVTGLVLYISLGVFGIIIWIVGAVVGIYCAPKSKTAETSLEGNFNMRQQL